VRNPDPGLYREAEIAFGSNESYRGFLSRGRIAGRLRLMLGGSEWDFRKPYLAHDEAERFRRHVSDLGVDARWDGKPSSSSIHRAAGDPREWNPIGTACIRPVPSLRRPAWIRLPAGLGRSGRPSSRP